MPEVKYTAIAIFGLVSSHAFASNESSPACSKPSKITFERNNIFDPKEPGFGLLHHWANSLHIKTKKFTLENESAFFAEQCEHSQEELQELERHLRQKKYLRDAQVSQDPQGNVTVKTWDTWSLTPTAGFGRKGGKNKFSIGLKDRNLLGLGVNTELRYFTNPQRKGYKLKFNSPLFMANNLNLGVVFSDTNDGQFKNLTITKPFVSFDTSDSFLASVSSNVFTQSVFHNGITSTQYKVKQNSSNFNYGWLHNNDPEYVLRFTTGFNLKKENFAHINSAQPTAYTPSDREYKSLAFGVDYFTKQYRKLSNTYLINQTEDINLGLSLSAKLGIASDCNLSGLVCYPFSLKGSKGWQADPDTLMLLNFSTQGVLNDREYKSITGAAINRISASLSAELFHSFSPAWRFYSRGEGYFTSRPYKDSYATLGGTTGVRGYAIDYQQGKARTVLNTELRYYPNLNIYKLMEVATAAFVDVGKTFGKPLTPNVNNAWLASVGVGVRLFSPHASEKQVGHIDLAFPITSGQKVNNYEIRISTKQTF